MSKRQFGLIGKNIAYSFSKKYFTEKFALGNLSNCTYDNFDIQSIEAFPTIIADNPELKGLNITIPYKEAVIPYLDQLSDKAAKIGAVNVIRFTKKGNLKGYNSDYYGFMKSLEPLLQPHHQKALILGTGGAAKAVAFALEQLGLLYIFVSREIGANCIHYDQINATTFDHYQIIINCTPLGTITGMFILGFYPPSVRTSWLVSGWCWEVYLNRLVFMLLRMICFENWYYIA